MRLVEGEIVDGRYRLIARIGSGGMADVWKATDNELGREVALKILHENFARDGEFVERFRREASAAAGLQHPNVVGVFDRGDYEGTYYIAMEYIDGSSLRDLADGGLEIHEAVEATRQILTAASFAHSRGIIHRDLKPMNVLIDRDGRIKVTDFGIARAGGSEITRTGSVMGTAQYLSPEQAQGTETTAASDIYSIGIMLFELLAGRVPFDGDNAVAIAMKQVAEPPPLPSSINPAVTPALDAVVLKALAKDPAERYQSADEMIAALDAAEAEPEVAVLPVVEEEEEGWSRRRKLLAALLVLLLLAGGVLLWLLTRDDGVPVPDVADRPEAAATIALQQAGFEVAVEREQTGVPEGTVIEQDPRGGTDADEGSTVTIIVSLGPGAVEIPRVAGLRQDQAERKLEDAGFEEIEVERRPSSSVRSGRAIGTSPAARVEIAVDETITLLISRGVETASVPDVIGLDRSDAASQLEQAGFVVNEDPSDSDEPEDTVIDQNPAGGETAEVGDEVTITYSTGVGTITLEDFVGQRASFAERRLGNQGLAVSVITQEVSQSSDDGIVLQQSPGAGTRLSPGDRVTLTVGEFVEPDEPDPQPDPPTTTDPPEMPAP